MSYAAVASNNIPPINEQPQPDKNLLNTRSPQSLDSLPVDDTQKVNIAPQDFKQHPHTTTSDAIIIPQNPEALPQSNPISSQINPSHNNHNHSEHISQSLWDHLIELVLRPAVAGGIVGIVNVGLIASTGYAFYSRPAYRSDPVRIGSTIAGALLALGTEAYLADAYRQTEQGKIEYKQARKQGAYLYRQAKQTILRPRVMGGIVGVLNLTTLAAVGYLAYENWHLPKWDRGAVSAITIGLLGLSLGEGYIEETYYNQSN